MADEVKKDPGVVDQHIGLKIADAVLLNAEIIDVDLIISQLSYIVVER